MNHLVRRLAVALPVAALAVLAQAAVASANGIGGDGSRPVGAGGGTPVSPVARVWVKTQSATGVVSAGSTPDPDGWGLATTGRKFSAVMEIAGGTDVNRPADAQGNCVPSGPKTVEGPTISSPSMTINTTPNAPEDDGVGGIVGLPVHATIDGYAGEEVASAPVGGSVTNCILNTGTNPPTVQADVVPVPAAYVAYTGNNPTWIWSDGTGTAAGWSQNHTYVRSSTEINGQKDRDTYKLGTMLVPDKGWSFIMMFTIGLDLQVRSVDGGVLTQQASSSARYRVFPVREVQAVLH